VVVGGLVVVVVIEVLLVEATAVDLAEVPPQLLASRHPARARPNLESRACGTAHLEGRGRFKRNHPSEAVERMPAALANQDRQDHNLIG
jgi:hypothetical protein